ncbi:MAG: FAD-dependent oxidoreductase [Mucilaginibacter sp.]|nr:MAG: FAD-dependent oxidoreductase [Mucilaginibacter sp.]HEK22051.1 NAD(P)/FAD-dependent oxidoreductase [Bacteroidota bacterium]
MNIIIIGGGFGGVNLAMGLAGNTCYDVTLIDKNNYNFFPPLIYQVATAFLDPSSISFPFRKLFHRHENLHFRLGELQTVIPAKNKIILADSELNYDYLVFATGTATNYFGLENIIKNAIPMKTLNDAIEMRNTLLQHLEIASKTSEAEKNKYGAIVIAGGGPTGVELSGVFAEMSKTLFAKEYVELAHIKQEIILVDGGQALLKPMSPKSQRYTYEALTKMGVTVKFGVHVKDYVNDKVYLDNGEILDSKILIWAAGVSAQKFDGLPEPSYDKNNRMIVNELNRLINTENIYAIGDTCIQTTDLNYPGGHPQVAQVAIQQGKNLAKNFVAMQKKSSPTPFNYFDKGSMAIIGKNKAVVDLPQLGLHFSGFTAWLMWLFVHLTFLVNYRNSIKTFINWTAAYFSGDQSLRMIIRPRRKN